MTHYDHFQEEEKYIVRSEGKWDERFLRRAAEVGTWSKDRSRGVGCAIIGPDKEERAQGYNGFPRGINDDVNHRHTRPYKYWWTQHAERNAINNAARIGMALKDCTAYCTLYPCAGCMGGLIQVGITRIVTPAFPDFNDLTYGEEWRIAEYMRKEARLKLTLLPGVITEVARQA